MFKYYVLTPIARIAHVKQMLGLLQEAIDEYSNILEREKSYIPACIGKEGRIFTH